MATEINTWQIVDGKLVSANNKLSDTGRKEKEDLEVWIKSNPIILGHNLIIIGEQVRTKSGPLDLLAIDDQGNTVIVELKSVVKIQPVHKKQLLTYLPLAGKPLGLVINFNETLLKNGVTRLVNNL